MIWDRIKDRVMHRMFVSRDVDAAWDDIVQNGMRDDNELRDAARRMTAEIRHYLEFMTGSDDGAGIAEEMRNDSEVPVALRWLAELEWQMFHIADGIPYEAIEDFRRHG